MSQANQKRITRKIAGIVGAFALGLAGMYGLTASLERRNDDMRLHRTEVREFFRLVTAFQDDFDRMVTVSDGVGSETPLIDEAQFLKAQSDGRGHLADLRRANIDKFMPNVDRVASNFEDYAAAARVAVAETKAIGIRGAGPGLGSEIGASRNRMENAALSTGGATLFAGLSALNRAQFKFFAERLYNDPAQVTLDTAGDREGLLKVVDGLVAAARASAMNARNKSEFAEAAEAYRAGVDRVFTSTKRRAEAMTMLAASQAALAQNVGSFRRALFSENDIVYAQEEEYREASRSIVGATVALFSLGFIFLVVAVGGRLRREAFLEQDRTKIFKDFALSSRSVSWETDAFCRYTRRETSGGVEDSAPGRLGRPMIESEAAPNIEFEGRTVFDLVGQCLPYRDILFCHTNDAGQKTWWRSSGTPYYDIDGKFLGYRGITLDVTETKNFEHAVAEMMARSRDFAAASSDEQWEIDGNGIVRALETQSPLADKMREIGLGRRFEELVAMADAKTESGESLDRYIELRRPFRDLVYSGFDLSTGAREWFRMSGVPFFDPKTGNMGMRCVNARITTTRMLELENRERQRQLEALVSNLPIIVQRVRSMGPDAIEVVYASPGIETILGIPADSLLGLKPKFRFRNAIHPDDRQYPIDAVRAALDHGRDYEVTYRARTSSGTYKILQDRGRVMVDTAGNRFVETIALDVTDAEERRERELELQGRLVEAQKMEAMGRLAGGIAHDFNNILGATRSFGDLLADGLPEGSRLHGYAVRIVAACDRAADMVRQILTFTRAKDAPREVVKVAEVVREMQALLAERLPPQVELAIDNREVDAVLVIHPSHLTQVLLNLAVNAGDALDGAPGRIEIAVREITAGEEASFTPGLNVAGDGSSIFYANGILTADQRYLRISVSDTGAGIHHDIAAKIFDPFFTTKDKRNGSGLGLSVVTGIVGAHDGVISVESTIGRGTTFSIYFPAVRGSRPAVRPAPAESRAVDKRRIRGKERILIVDDEIDLADSLSYALTNLGYETAPVYSSTEALELFQESPESWDVLVTDQVMPELKGLDLIHRLRFIKPGLRTILCTGFSDHTTDAAVAGDGVDAFFNKPVPADVIATSIRSFFDTKSASWEADAGRAAVP